MGLPDTQVNSCSAPSHYSLIWNGLGVCLPSSWEAIPKDNSHFIFESELKPVLEIRWEKPGKEIRPDERLKAVLTELRKKKPEPLRPMPPPVFLADISKEFLLSCYGREHLDQPEGACIVCKECGTIILAHFFPGWQKHRNELSAVFQKIDCHRHQEKKTPWTILDVSFRPPDSYELDRFFFDYGMSRIEFKNKKSRLTLFRLAPASKYLEGSSLGELFSAFNQTDPATHQILDCFTIVHSSTPGSGARLLARLGKKQPYRWSRFMHFEHADRILGLWLKSSAPLIQTHIDTIGDSYGIVQD